MSTAQLPPLDPISRQGWRLALRAFGRALLRLLVILLAAALLAAIFLWGVPELIRRYIVPLEEAQERLERFQLSQEQANTQFEQRIMHLTEELATLEAAHQQDAQAIAALRAQATQMQDDLQARLSGAQSDIEGALERLEDFDRALVRLNATLTRLEADREADRRALGTLAAGEQIKRASVAVLHREILMLKAMQLLIRSRLFLLQSNFGLARQDVQAARQLLAGMHADLPDHQAAFLQEILARLDLALANLPEWPVMAAEDLEIAWELLVLGLPDEAQATAAAAATRTTVFASPTSTRTHTATMTPTPEPTATPTPTLVESPPSPTP